jgi:SAM-dependent methyltransferase
MWMGTGSPAKTEWTAWGEHDPLWGAASWCGHGQAGARPWTSEQFYETGRLDWESFFARWQAYRLDTTSCLEIACGAGRITKPMTSAFDHVYAIDISPSMIAKAREHVGDENVTFIVTDGRSMPLDDDSVTAAFSNHAFHHFDSVDHGAWYFEELVRVLIPGGTLMVNLDVHQHPSPHLMGFGEQFTYVQRSMYSGLLALSSLTARLRRQRLLRGGNRSDLFMRFISYEVDWIFLTLDRLGYIDVELSIFPAPRPPFGSERDELLPRLHPFVFARKPRTQARVACSPRRESATRAGIHSTVESSA